MIEKLMYRGNMKPTLFVLLCLFGTSFLLADPQGDFYTSLKGKNFVGALETLKSWEQVEPNSPEVVVGYVNYYFSKSMSYGYSIDDFSQEGPSQTTKKLQLVDPKSGKTFYFNNKIFYNGDDISLAMKYFEEGIAKFPRRLDIRFGKIHVANQVGDFATASDEVVSLLKFSTDEGNTWLWSNNRPYERDVPTFLGDLQNYYNLWYQSGSEAGFEALRVASEAQIQRYPSHSWAYDNLALYYTYKKDNDNQIRFLLKALEIDPNDAVTLNNIANFYRLGGETEKAVHYYKLVLTTNDPKHIEQAKKMLEQLEK